MPNDSNIPDSSDPQNNKRKPDQEDNDDTDSLTDGQGVSLKTLAFFSRSVTPTPTSPVEPTTSEDPHPRTTASSSSFTTNPALTNFFESFKGPQGYVYNPSNSSQDEFARLAKLRGWGPKSLRKHKRRFEEILGQCTTGTAKPVSCEDEAPTPIEEFLRSQEREGFSFRFKKGVHPGTQWTNLRKARGFKGDNKSKEYENLRWAWFGAVEADLNDLLPDDAPNAWSWVCFILELISKEEYVAGISGNKAKKLVSKVFVNIFDFRQWARGGYKNGVAGLRTFPTRRDLAMYTKNKRGRTFPLEIAKKDGKDGVARWLLHDFRRFNF